MILGLPFHLLYVKEDVVTEDDTGITTINLWDKIRIESRMKCATYQLEY